jgi:hypothetical protein
MSTKLTVLGATICLLLICIVIMPVAISPAVAAQALEETPGPQSAGATAAVSGTPAHSTVTWTSLPDGLPAFILIAPRLAPTRVPLPGGAPEYVEQPVLLPDAPRLAPTRVPLPGGTPEYVEQPVLLPDATRLAPTRVPLPGGTPEYVEQPVLLPDATRLAPTRVPLPGGTPEYVEQPVLLPDATRAAPTRVSLPTGMPVSVGQPVLVPNATPAAVLSGKPERGVGQVATVQPTPTSTPTPVASGAPPAMVQVKEPSPSSPGKAISASPAPILNEKPAPQPATAWPGFLLPAAWLLPLGTSILAGCGFVGWQIARQTRIQQATTLARMRMEVDLAAANYRPRDEDPIKTIRRIASRAMGRDVGDLTPLRGSVSPIYLIFLENRTGRKLLLVALDHLKAALTIENGYHRRFPWARSPRFQIDPLTGGIFVLEEIACAWTALAEQLALPEMPPLAEKWQLVELPVES